MNLFRAIFGKDRKAYREVGERVSEAAKANQIAARRLMETLDICNKMRQREEENHRALLNAMSHKQRRYKGGFV